MNISSILSHVKTALTASTEGAASALKKEGAESAVAMARDTLTLSARKTMTRDMASVGLLAMDKAVDWAAANKAGSAALEGIIAHTDSPVAKVLHQAAKVEPYFEDGAHLLRAGLNRPRLLEGGLTREANARAMAEIGVLAMEKATTVEGAARVGMVALDGIIAQTGSPVAKTLHKTASAAPHPVDMANLLQEGLSRPHLLEGALTREANIQAMAQLGVVGINKATTAEGATKIGLATLDGIMGQTTHPVPTELRRAVDHQPWMQGKAEMLHEGLSQLEKAPLRWSR